MAQHKKNDRAFYELYARGRAQGAPFLTWGLRIACRALWRRLTMPLALFNAAFGTEFKPAVPELKKKAPRQGCLKPESKDKVLASRLTARSKASTGAKAAMACANRSGDTQRGSSSAPDSTSACVASGAMCVGARTTTPVSPLTLVTGPSTMPAAASSARWASKMLQLQRCPAPQPGTARRLRMRPWPARLFRWP